jgi:N4-(beta-N-acetylglucosaminyl)-L-asparaginase
MIAVSAIAFLSILLPSLGNDISTTKRMVINTWGGPFANATVAAFQALSQGGSALDAIESGCKYCEEHQCDTTVGFGNHPDTSGRTTLDAMIMDGNTFDVGSVGYIRHYRDAISIARAVMTYTGHTLLVGDGAESFASMMGFTKRDATDANSIHVYEEWREANCQPNFYENIPEAKVSCGPYSPTHLTKTADIQAKGVKETWKVTHDNHDTIGMVSIDGDGNMACGTSTNGANHKVAGRIGDSPITGAGCYVNTLVGGAAATGDGDVMMRFLPSFAAVSFMEQGVSPSEACNRALLPIVKAFPTFSGGVVCVNRQGEYGAATQNMDFAYSVFVEGMSDVEVVPVN